MQFLKIFRRILAVIIGISLLYILTSKVLPLFGLTLTCSITGTSMKPAMKGYNLAIMKKVPFEEIKEGDIIGFNKRVGDDRLMTGGVVLEFRKKVLDENGKTETMSSQRQGPLQLLLQSHLLLQPLIQMALYPT